LLSYFNGLNGREAGNNISRKAKRGIKMSDIELTTKGSAAEEKIGSVVKEGSGSAKEVFVTAAPIIVSVISFSLMGMVDTIIMGRVGTVEQGATGLGGMLSWGLCALFTGTLTAVNTFVAQDYGARNFDVLRRYVHSAALLVPFFSGLVFLTIPLFPIVLKLLGTSPEVEPEVVKYLSIRILGAPFLFTIYVITGFVRGLGDMKTPMIITIIANVVNAVLAVTLVFGYFGFPAMKVEGAATASLIAGGVEAALYLFAYFGRKNNALYKTRAWAAPRLDDAKRLLTLGLPIGFSWMFDMAAWTLFSIYAATLAPEALAAHMIIFQIIHFSFLPAVAFSIAGTTLVGQYIGARRVDLAEKSAKWTFFLGVGYMTLAGATMALLRYPLMNAFNPDPKVVAIGAVLVLIAAVFQPFDAVGIVSMGILRGAGDTKFPLLTIIICSLTIFLPGVYYFAEYLRMGIVGAWIGALCYIVIFGVVIILRVRKGGWKKTRLAQG